MSSCYTDYIFKTFCSSQHYIINLKRWLFRKFKKRQKKKYTSSRKRFTDPPVSSLYVFTARIGLPSYHCVSMFIPLRSVSNRWSKYTAMIVYFQMFSLQEKKINNSIQQPSRIIKIKFQNTKNYPNETSF